MSTRARERRCGDEGACRGDRVHDLVGGIGVALEHGFRRAENIKRSLDGELYFYSKVFGFELAEPVEPVTIENLK